MEEKMKDKDIMKIADYAIGRILQKGANEGQIFVTESETREINMEDNEFTLYRTINMEDINLLIYKDKKRGSYFTNKADNDTVNMAVDMALASMENANADDANGIAPDQGMIDASKGVWEADMDRFFDRLDEFRNDIRKSYPKISIYQIVAKHDRRHMVYRNTNGTRCNEYTGSYNVILHLTGREGEKTTELNTVAVTLKDLDKPIIKCGDIESILKNVEAQLHVKPMQGKFKGVMMLTPGVVEKFTYYFGNLAGGGAILEGSSIWLDKLDKKVANEKLSIRFEVNDENIVTGETLTFDGFRSEGYDFIKEGVLKSFITNYYVSKKTGCKMSPNGAFNAIISAGDISYEDMIKKIDRGILVGSFSGNVPSVNGDFSGVAKNSFLIENGRITGAVAEVMISGNLADMLLNIRDISKEKIYKGYGVYPYISADGIVVSGKN